MSISATVFRRAFDRFQAIHMEQCGFALDSFRNPLSFAFITEDYKEDIGRQAVRLLDARKWTPSEIGTGRILDRVIAAIEIPDNNLLSWQPRFGLAKRVHVQLHEAKQSPELRKQLEELFFDLYHHNHTDRELFDRLMEICRPRYELLAYLFFVADRHSFLPIRTMSFDKALAELELPLRTSHQCGWENYQDFIAAIRDVQACLKAEGIADPTLLDAHSFCWILATTKTKVKPAIRQEQKTEQRPFAGVLRPASEPGEVAPKNDVAEVDMLALSKRREASGRIAEDIAFQAERDRLIAEGRDDLADRVGRVSDRPGYGFDIRSFNSDGTERCIEVKNVSNGNRFFLSDWEWRNSRARPNYWFYLVSDVDAGCPQIDMLPAAQLLRDNLRPIQYCVTFDL